jgi:hypothetical protein
MAGQPEPVANSTEQHSGTRRSMPIVPLRRVRAGELRWETFLYTLKASPAARQRHPVTEEPASPSTSGGQSTPDKPRGLSGAASQVPHACSPHPGLLDDLLRAMLARRPLVMEPALGSPTTTRTPQPANRGLDVFPSGVTFGRCLFWAIGGVSSRGHRSSW